VRARLRQLPCVWLMGNRRRPDWGDQVMPDSYEIGDLAARHLIERGHRRLAFLNLDAGHWPFRLYYQSFAAAATDAHAEVRPVQQLTPSSQSDYWHRFSNESVENLINQFMEISPRPTGLFVADDMQVALIQPALQSRGVDIGPYHHEREFSMLVLSRKLGEKIVIGDNIVVTVVKIDRNQIRIGIEAPHEVPVYREEISPARVANVKLPSDEPALSR